MKKIFYTLIIVLAVGTVKAQTEVSFGADVVSSYVWRGTLCAGTSIQPAVGLNIGDFSIGAWGSVDNSNQGFKEVDLAVSYTFGGLTVGVTDYWWNGEGAFDYFHFKNNESSHLLEANLSYAHSSGLLLGWNTMLAGTQDKDLVTGSRRFSSYAEAGYTFDVGGVELTTALGFCPWKPNQMYGTTTEKFAVTNVSLGASKTIEVTNTFSIPVSSQLIFNPANEDVFLVFGVSF